MTTVLNHLEKAIRATAKANSKTLQFIASFEGANGKNLRSRWELWLQIELMRQLEVMKFSFNDLYSEYRAEYKENKDKGAKRSENGFTSGSMDLAFRPKDGDKGLLAGVELKAKSKPSNAIRGGLHDLLKPRAFKLAGWKFRAVYSMCVYPKGISDESDSKYLSFVDKRGWRKFPLGKHFEVALIGWEAKPRSGDLKKFYAEYNVWMKDLLSEAKASGLTINVKAKSA